MNSEFDLPALTDGLVGDDLRDGDVLVVSSKFVAISEGRIVSLSSVLPRAEAREVAAKYGFSPQLCELILRESDEVIGGVPGFVLAVNSELLTPHAALDTENIEHRRIVLSRRSHQQSAG